MSTAWSLEPTALSRPADWKQWTSLIALRLHGMRTTVQGLVCRVKNRRRPLTDLSRLDPHLLADIGYDRSAPLAQATRQFWHR